MTSVSYLDDRRRTTDAVEWPPALGPDVGYRPATFEEYLLSVGLAKRTIAVYLWRLGWAERTIAEMGGSLVTADARLLAELSARSATSHSMRGQLRCTLKHFYAWHDRTDAPLRAVRVPPAPRMVNKALEASQTHRLVEVASGWWPEGTAVLMGLYLALRREEIARAEWDRFDGPMDWYTVTGKRDKTATLPVHPRLRAELEEHRQETGYLFRGRFGGHVNPNTVWDWTIRVGQAAGVDHLRPHQLRHTALTTALDNTENLRSVMEFARHEKPQTTAGYTRTTKEQLQRVAEALDY